MSVCILVFDNDNFDRAKASAAELRAAGADAVIHHVGIAYNPDGSRSLVQLSKIDLVLFHQRNETDLDAIRVSARCRISYSGGPGADIPRSISQDGLTTDEARHIITQLRSETGDIKDRILTFWSDRSNLLALRFLCEAYALSPVGPGKKNYPPNASDSANVIINCPDPSDWLALIGVPSPTSDQDSAAIMAFGNLMGAATGEARALAVAITQRNPDISNPARTYVQKVKEITGDQGGLP